MMSGDAPTASSIVKPSARTFLASHLGSRGHERRPPTTPPAHVDSAAAHPSVAPTAPCSAPPPGGACVTWQGIVDARSLPPDMTSVGAKATAAVVAAERARTSALERLRDDRLVNVDESARTIAGALAAIPLDDTRARTAALEGFSMSELAPRIDAAIATLRRPGRPITAPTIETALRGIIAETMSSRDETMIADSALTAPPEEVAAELIQLIVARPPRPRPGAPLLPARPT